MADRNKFSITIIKAEMSDNADYEWMYENTIQHTLKEHFDWAENINKNITFEKIMESSPTGISLQVNANFTSAEDLCLFKLSFDTEPKTKLGSNSTDLSFYFY